MTASSEAFVYLFVVYCINSINNYIFYIVHIYQNVQTDTLNATNVSEFMMDYKCFQNIFLLTHRCVYVLCSADVCN